jgi:hypothetical protein
MLHPSRHDKELALLDPFVPVAKLHAEAALDHEEHLVFIRMMVKHELTEDFVQLDMLPIQFSYDIRLPVFRNLPKLLGDVDLVHVALPALVRHMSRFVGNKLVAKKFSAPSADFPATSAPGM